MHSLQGERKDRDIGCALALLCPIFFGKRKLFWLVLVRQGLSLAWAAGEHLSGPGREGKVVRDPTWVSLQLCTVTLHIHPQLNLPPDKSVGKMATLSSPSSALWGPWGFPMGL